MGARLLPDLTGRHIEHIAFCCEGELDRELLARLSHAQPTHRGNQPRVVVTEYTRRSQPHRAALLAETVAEDQRDDAALHIVVQFERRELPRAEHLMSVRGVLVVPAKVRVTVSQFEALLSTVATCEDKEHAGLLTARVLLPKEEYASNFELPMAVDAGIEVQGVRLVCHEPHASVIVDVGESAAESIEVSLQCGYDVFQDAGPVESALRLVDRNVEPFIREVRGKPDGT